LAIASPIIAFLVAYVALVLLSARGAKAYTSIAVMILVYALLSSTSRQAEKAFQELAHWNDIRVFVYIFLSLFLAGLMREKGLLDKLVESTSAIGCRFSLLSVPAIIGLIPMPGGALVSAIALKRKFFEEARVGREEATYLNYWFRHIWVPSWPLFQSVVITASVFSIDPITVIAHTWPATPAAILGGLLVAWPLLRGVDCERPHKSPARWLAISLWPLLALAVLFLASRTQAREALGGIMPGYAREPMLTSLVAIVVVFLLLHRPGFSQVGRALRLASRPTIHLVLFESLYFKNMIIETSAGSSIAGLVGSGIIPLWLITIIIPFILGLAAGGENFFASTAMPLLLPYIASGSINWLLLSLAYLGGFLGVMASPVHLCLVLTSEYYQSRMSRTLAYVYVSVILSLAIGGTLLWMAWGNNGG